MENIVKDFNAQHARDLLKDAQTWREELPEILQLIQKAASEGMSQLHLEEVLHKQTLEELRKRAFTVFIHPSGDIPPHHPPTLYTISWAE